MRVIYPTASGAHNEPRLEGVHCLTVSGDLMPVLTAQLMNGDRRGRGVESNGPLKLELSSPGKGGGLPQFTPHAICSINGGP